MTDITDEMFETARGLRQRRIGWNRIARVLGVSVFSLRYELDPNYRKHRRRRNGVPGEKLPDGTTRAEPANRVAAFEHVPSDVLREREQRLRALRGRTLTQTFFGDPPRGFSALDQRAKD